MSKTLSQFVELNGEHSTINNSKGKAQFSFPKAGRFQYSKKSPNEEVGYDLPDVKAQRTTTFGFGKKSDFGANHACKFSSYRSRPTAQLLQPPQRLRSSQTPLLSLQLRHFA